MDPEKAKKLALVRKRVRENECSDTGSVSKRRRLTDPTERTQLRNRNDRFLCYAVSDSGYKSVVGSDRAVNYWTGVLYELEGDDDPPVVLHMNTQNAVAAKPDAERFSKKLAEIRVQSLAAIPEPDQTPFPSFIDCDFFLVCVLDENYKRHPFVSDIDDA
ncbi:hypothetical protein F441_17612 [Phytophthora nicotianae CJ01A1]|uniref:Uncharacterized protein n=2 Tax=Phytophthora nicotianae TaxID=4792 RepID=W2W7A1_PHYNI|nr:hypothetical protein L914_17061 [Phytophthora nicotianae]ETP05868.1 hypothetical protein F441_17612 [Phytophthora nicotianae CJ01A1]